MQVDKSLFISLSHNCVFPPLLAAHNAYVFNGGVHAFTPTAKEALLFLCACIGTAHRHSVTRVHTKHPVAHAPWWASSPRAVKMVRHARGAALRVLSGACGCAAPRAAGLGFAAASPAAVAHRAFGSRRRPRFAAAAGNRCLCTPLFGRAVARRDREPPPRGTLVPHRCPHARLAPCQPSHKSFKIKRILGKKQKQNRPIPQWIRLRTDNTIRCAAATGWLAGACCAAAALRCAASVGGFALQCCLARLRFGRLPPGSVAVIAR